MGRVSNGVSKDEKDYPAKGNQRSDDVFAERG
jgi:hypothetical protein